MFKIDWYTPILYCQFWNSTFTTHYYFSSYSEDTNGDVPIRSTVESIAIPARYIKSVLNVQSPTEASRLGFTIFSDLNENDLDDIQQDRPNRKVEAVGNKGIRSKTEHPDSNMNDDRIDKNNQL